MKTFNITTRQIRQDDGFNKTLTNVVTPRLSKAIQALPCHPDTTHLGVSLYGGVVSHFINREYDPNTGRSRNEMIEQDHIYDVTPEQHEELLDAVLEVLTELNDPSWIIESGAPRGIVSITIPQVGFACIYLFAADRNAGRHYPAEAESLLRKGLFLMSESNLTTWPYLALPDVRPTLLAGGTNWKVETIGLPTGVGLTSTMLAMGALRGPISTLVAAGTEDTKLPPRREQTGMNVKVQRGPRRDRNKKHTYVELVNGEVPKTMNDASFIEEPKPQREVYKQTSLSRSSEPVKEEKPTLVEVPQVNIPDDTPIDSGDETE
jgi:hypothetical protein